MFRFLCLGKFLQQSSRSPKLTPTEHALHLLKGNSPIANRAEENLGQMQKRPSTETTGEIPHIK